MYIRKRRLLWAGLMVLLLTGALLPASAQNVLERMRRKAEQTAQDKAVQKTGEAVDKAMDKAIGKATGTDKKGQTGGAAADPQPENPADDAKKQLTYYAKYDFIPGDAVFYSNDFAEESPGELPTGWNSNGSAVVVTLDNHPGQWLRMAQKTRCLTDNKTPFGPDFSVEFDMLVAIDFQGWYPPSFRFGLLATGSEAPDANRFLSDPVGDKSFYMEISPMKEGASFILESQLKHARYFHSPVSTHPVFSQWYGREIHVAIQGQKERLRIWLNGSKVYDAPKAIPPDGVFNQLYFDLGSSPYQDEQIGVYLRNIRMAKGLPDTRHKLIEEGKFSTTGILFDSGSAVIKPESAGVLNEIAALLRRHSDISVDIIGHTDADGDEKLNLQLSEKRALAVKEILEKSYSIEGGRLHAAGKGEREPVADNATREGKARNRRVEFIRR